MATVAHVFLKHKSPKISNILLIRSIFINETVMRGDNTKFVYHAAPQKFCSPNWQVRCSEKTGKKKEEKTVLYFS